MGKVIHVKLGEHRNPVLCDCDNVEYDRDDYVILTMDRGSEFGRVTSDIKKGCVGKTGHVKGKIVRKATDGDLRQIENNRFKAAESLNTCVRKINERKLDMRVVKAEYTFDSSKIIFFFTSDGRVDFRSLVKDLARIFRVRIELKQIGVRDKAKMVSGYGICGREVCCSSYIKNFAPLNIKMAKEQGLPLNPSRISGVCGRIKCCMAYEYNVYKEYAKDMPRFGATVSTPEGRGLVINVNVLKRYVDVDLGEGKIVQTKYGNRVKFGKPEVSSEVSANIP